MDQLIKRDAIPQTNKSWVLVAAILGISFGTALFPEWRTEQQEKPTVIANASGPVELVAGPTRVVLTMQTPLATHIKSLRPGQHIYVVLRDLRSSEAPGILYHVYLDLAPGTNPGNYDPHYVGTLNFFNAIRSGGSWAAASKKPRFFSYDITSMLKSFLARKLLSDQTVITILPGGLAITKSRPTIGKIEIILQ